MNEKEQLLKEIEDDAYELIKRFGSDSDDPGQRELEAIIFGANFMLDKYLELEKENDRLVSIANQQTEERNKWQSKYYKLEARIDKLTNSLKHSIDDFKFNEELGDL